MSHINFSIIIPTYKRDVLLKEAVYSAVRQSVDISYEILVLDNNVNSLEFKS